MKKMKGISPIIAAVILIGIALVIGVMISTWITRFVTTTTEEAATCIATTSYTLTGATYNSTSNVTKVKLTNLGSDDVYNFTFEWDNATIVSFAATSPSATTKISQGRSTYVTRTQYIAGTISTLTVVAQSCVAAKPSPVSVTTVS